MAENTYEYECMRAELLGIDKPNHDDWLKKQQEQKKINGDTDNDDLTAENLQNVDVSGENMGRISGGLDELNGILQITQRKINRFKTSCGNLTNLLRFRMGGASGEVRSVETASTAPVDDEKSGDVVTTSPKLQSNLNNDGDQRKSDLGRALDNHVDCIDAMLEKAENAQYSMAYQNKEMKRFLR